MQRAPEGVGGLPVDACQLTPRNEKVPAEHPFCRLIRHDDGSVPVKHDRRRTAFTESIQRTFCTREAQHFCERCSRAQLSGEAAKTLQLARREGALLDGSLDRQAPEVLACRNLYSRIPSQTERGQKFLVVWLLANLFRCQSVKIADNAAPHHERR